MPTMLHKNAYDTVCHEHLEYYSLEQVLWMAKRTGLKIIDVKTNDINGESFSVVATKADSNQIVSPSVSKAIAKEREAHLDAPTRYKEFAQRVADSHDTLRDFLDRARAQGRCRASRQLGQNG